MFALDLARAAMDRMRRRTATRRMTRALALMTDAQLDDLGLDRDVLSGRARSDVTRSL